MARMPSGADVVRPTVPGQLAERVDRPLGRGVIARDQLRGQVIGLALEPAGHQFRLPSA